MKYYHIIFYIVWAVAGYIIAQRLALAILVETGPSYLYLVKYIGAASAALGIGAVHLVIRYFKSVKSGRSVQVNASPSPRGKGWLKIFGGGLLGGVFGGLIGFSGIRISYFILYPFVRLLAIVLRATPEGEGYLLLILSPFLFGLLGVSLGAYLAVGKESRRLSLFWMALLIALALSPSLVIFGIGGLLIPLGVAIYLEKKTSSQT